ncbi:uncharacterized protein LOC122384727 [Amphibalanus amphitrite]|uniref:uncharacterized protein LOC122384727 n=1 Tax=Amphibalanus amphitrite TaxID=1232801 RepID=UPI001C91A1D8|nr:uncharacterized protein LOC122384727 [Amphibalanus amphitrite]
MSNPSTQPVEPLAEPKCHHEGLLNEEWPPERESDPIALDARSESDLQLNVKEEIKMEVSSPKVERSSSPLWDDDPLSHDAEQSPEEEEKFRYRSPSPSEDFVGFTEVDRYRTLDPIPEGSQLMVYDGGDSAQELTVHSETSGESKAAPTAGPSSSESVCDVSCHEWDGESPASGPLNVVPDIKMSPVERRGPAVERSSCTLPPGWDSYLSPWEQSWIGGLFRTTTHGGRRHAELRDGLTELWCRPPEPPAVASEPPADADRYYGVPLFLWLPRRLWGASLFCPQCGALLNGFGLHSRLRKALDLSLGYWIATECLTCPQCRPQKVYAAWDHRLVRQLDLGRQQQFPAVLKNDLACDKAIISLFRSTGPWRNPAEIQRNICDGVGQAYLTRTLCYLSHCDEHSAAPGETQRRRPVALPPPHPVVPSAKRLMRVYLRETHARQQRYLATITSVFGDVLKMDSSRKLTQKFAGVAAGSARWTTVTNEYDQVLMCVLTPAAGDGLLDMGRSLVMRYRDATMGLPRLLYVDTGCCGGSENTPAAPALRWFPGWESVPVRLDAEHFMLRMAAGVTTKRHQLYGRLVSGLADAIFETDPADMKALVRAKRHELRARGLVNVTDEMARQAVTEAERQRHCRRRTRGVDVTTRAIDELLRRLSGPAGTDGPDGTGMPLLDPTRIWAIWEEQKRHLACLQDVPGVALYRETSPLTRRGAQLQCYSSARGTTFAESFHKHLAKFIPGNAALRDLHFQALLVEGVARWNTEHHRAKTEPDTADNVQLQFLDDWTRATLNDLSLAALNKKFLKTNHGGRVWYNGELVGVAYLYSQTGRQLDNYVEGELDPGTQHGDQEDDGLDEAFEGTEGAYDYAPSLSNILGIPEASLCAAGFASGATGGAPGAAEGTASAGAAGSLAVGTGARSPAGAVGPWTTDHTYGAGLDS